MLVINEYWRGDRWLVSFVRRPELLKRTGHYYGRIIPGTEKKFGKGERAVWLTGKSASASNARDKEI